MLTIPEGVLITNTEGSHILQTNDELFIILGLRPNTPLTLLQFENFKLNNVREKIKNDNEISVENSTRPN